MKAEDTVMGEEQVANAMGHSQWYMRVPCNRNRFNEGKEVSKAQAEITWPIAKQAGQREVVEWFMGNYPEVCDEHLQAKLPVWGLL